MMYKCLHVVDGLYGELVGGPVRADGHCGEVQPLQLDPLNSACYSIVLPVPENKGISII